MSHSTQVRVTVGPTTIEYTFGSGTVASNFGVYEVRQPLTMEGYAAIGALNCGLSSDLLPEPELQFVQGCVQRWIDFIGNDPILKKRLIDQVLVRITRFD